MVVLAVETKLQGIAEAMLKTDLAYQVPGMT